MDIASENSNSVIDLPKILYIVYSVSTLAMSYELLRDRLRCMTKICDIRGMTI